MYVGLGFLAAGLCALVILPFVHARAVCLAACRLEAAVPVSMAEIKADKDQLRAELVLSLRRLEGNVRGTLEIVKQSSIACSMARHAAPWARQRRCAKIPSH